MVKILGISGSPRKAATEYCVLEALDAAKTVPGVTTEFFTIRDKKFGFCIHCDRCLHEKKIECVRQEDDLTGLAQKFLEADGYIIGSPVYGMNISGQLQVLFNRFRAFWLLLQEDPRYFSDKVGGAIAVGGTRHGGQEMTLAAINNFYFQLGVKPVSGGPYAYNGAAVWSKDRREEGVKEDEVGLSTVRVIGMRVAEAAVVMKVGTEKHELRGEATG